MDVSIIIVSFNTKEKTVRCVKSVIDRTEGLKYEIIVSDNGSTDGTLDILRKSFPDIILIENNRNLGFGKANNIALNVARGKYIFYLNSDAYLLNNAIYLFFSYWENASDYSMIGALGANLLNEKREVVHSAASFPTYHKLCKSQFRVNLLNLLKGIVLISGQEKRYIYRSKKRANKRKGKYIYGEVDYITGADLFLRNNEDARFNPEYFMYYEETELEFRLFKKGFKRLIIEGPEIVHNNERETKEEFIIYSVTDVFREISSLIYIRNNLRKRSILLKILIHLNWMNPAIKQVKNQALGIVKNSYEKGN